MFATDSILATLMCSSRSEYSWDIVVQKIGGKVLTSILQFFPPRVASYVFPICGLFQVFLDKRDNTEFDLLTVSETAAEPPQDEGNSSNSPRNLALEATFINHNFSQQVLKVSPHFIDSLRNLCATRGVSKCIPENAIEGNGDS